MSKRSFISACCLLVTAFSVLCLGVATFEVHNGLPMLGVVFGGGTLVIAFKYNVDEASKAHYGKKTAEKAIALGYTTEEVVLFLNAPLQDRWELDAAYERHVKHAIAEAHIARLERSL